MTDFGGVLMRVGEVARASGLTVRALHHYDEIGLLSPSRRSAAGHRLYGADDLHRLYRITALRQLGLPLGDVAAALRSGIDLADVLRRQLEAVDRQVGQLQALHGRLRALLGGLERNREPSIDDVLNAMKEMAMVGQYYNEDQQRALAERAAAMGPEGMATAEQDWANLIAEVQAAHAADLDPASEPVQALMRRWQALIEAFTGGDPGIRAGLERMYQEQGAEQASRGMVDPALMGYMRRAMEAGQ